MSWNVMIGPRVTIGAILRLLKVQSFDIAKNVTKMYFWYTVLHFFYVTIYNVVILNQNSFTLTVNDKNGYK